MKKLTSLSLLFFLVFIVSLRFVEASKTFHFAEYQIVLQKKNKASGESSEDLIKVFKKGALVHEIKGYLLEVVTLGFLKFVGDAERKPYLLVGSYTGGAHCCSGIQAYELEPFKKVFEISGDSATQLCSFMPTGDFFLEVVDNTFLYWHTSYADSANVKVNLKRGKKGLEVCPDCSYESVKEDEIFSLAKAISTNDTLWRIAEPEGKEPFYPGPLVQEVVRLIYLNKPDLAKRFIEEAWHPKNPHKQTFKRDLIKRVKESTYWEELEGKGYKLPSF